MAETQTQKNSVRGSAPPTLRPHDVAVLLWLVLMENQAEAEGKESEYSRWTLAQVAAGTHLSVSEIHFVLRRVATSRLYRPVERQVNRSALIEFVVHGVKYAFPPQRGMLVRGIPTAYAASPLKEKIVSTSEPSPVWPDAKGTMRGIAFSPLYSAAPEAALGNAEFYELLALVDALRGDARARERNLAHKMLRARVLKDTAQETMGDNT